eukprot:TRINITY_DN67449_c0_g1_i1.p2 TRINITY_DN67449_c0_g1~~TRINITY_DN67449_c0_g1_i1.p2  ORF type:complete len:179 (+),score=30.34 TRINITY_DN67449_c0_g1_i1:40-537(+)
MTMLRWWVAVAVCVLSVAVWVLAAGRPSVYPLSHVQQSRAPTNALCRRCQWLHAKLRQDAQAMRPSRIGRRGRAELLVQGWCRDIPQAVYTGSPGVPHVRTEDIKPLEDMCAKLQRHARTKETSLISSVEASHSLAALCDTMVEAVNRTSGSRRPQPPNTFPCSE